MPASIVAQDEDPDLGPPRSLKTAPIAKFRPPLPRNPLIPLDWTTSTPRVDLPAPPGRDRPAYSLPAVRFPLRRLAKLMAIPGQAYQREPPECSTTSPASLGTLEHSHKPDLAGGARVGRSQEGEAGSNKARVAIPHPVSKAD
jgi:hypothetical protein